MTAPHRHNKLLQHQERTRQVYEQRRGVLSTLTHLWQIVRRNNFRRRMEFSQIIPKKATVIAKMSTLNQKGCFW